jgi:hypothetical protein
LGGKIYSPAPPTLKAVLESPAARSTALPSFAVAQTITQNDTPLGVGASPDGRVTYILRYDGTTAAYDRRGKLLWETPALLEGSALAVSPDGRRVAVSGYPGLVALEAKTGKILGLTAVPSYRAPLDGYLAAPLSSTGWNGWPNRIVSVAWNSDGTRVAGGWENRHGAVEPVVLDAEGQLVCELKGIEGDVMGVAFLPKSNTLLLGANKLTAVDIATGAILWTQPGSGAQAFSFSADGALGAAGGWGRDLVVFKMTDGQVVGTAQFDAIIGGLAFLPDNSLAVAVWGGAHPLYRFIPSSGKTEELFQSVNGFQSVLWSPALKALLAAEQGGRLWLISPAGKALAQLDETAGTTAYRMQEYSGRILLGRMDRRVQWVDIP